MLLYQARSMSFSGPLPHPDVLASYDQVIPGLADRIVSEAHGQTSHRQALEAKALDGELWRSKAGVISALAVAIGGMAGGFALILMGKDVAGGLFAGVPIASIVGNFIYGTVSRRREREKKMEMVTGGPKEE